MFKMLERGSSKAGGAFARSWSPYYFLSFCTAPWLHVSRDCDPTIPYIVTPLELPL
jgi:hypothetical protein